MVYRLLLAVLCSIFRIEHEQAQASLVKDRVRHYCSHSRVIEGLPHGWTLYRVFTNGLFCFVLRSKRRKTSSRCSRLGIDGVRLPILLEVIESDFPCPRSRLSVWLRKIGLAVPTSARALVLRTYYIG